MIFPDFKGLPIIPTRSAMNEMSELGMTLWDVLEVLEYGQDCYASKRRNGTLERCLDKGKRTTKVVVIRSHNWSLCTDVWALVHVGQIARRRGKRR
jgi:hypothetical protein